MNFELEIAVTQSIFKLEELLRCQNLAKVIPSFQYFITFCSHLNGFFTIYENAISGSQLPPHAGRFDHHEGILGTQYRVFASCEETAQVKAKSDKISKTGNIFC